MVEITKVEGSKSDHKVLIYTLSTCGWCKKTKEFLSEHDISFEYIDIDLTDGEEGEKIRDDLKQHNPRGSCPTIVVDDGDKVIIGFFEDEIKEALGL